jgi:hypothetical protein
MLGAYKNGQCFIVGGIALHKALLPSSHKPYRA